MYAPAMRQKHNGENLVTVAAVVPPEVRRILEEKAAKEERTLAAVTARAIVNSPEIKRELRARRAT